MARYLAADVLAGRDSAVRLYPDSEGFALDAPLGDTAKAPQRATWPWCQRTAFQQVVF